MKEKTTNLKDFTFGISHIPLILKAFIRKTMVKIDHEAPPHGVAIEDFTNMSVVDAAKAMKPKKNPNIVWSESDQHRMSEGKIPKGSPEHLI